MHQTKLVDPNLSMIDNLDTMKESTANITALLQSAALGDQPESIGIAKIREGGVRADD